MKVTELINKLFELRLEYGEIDVVLPQAGAESDGTEIEWLARISDVEFRDNKDSVFTDPVIAIL